MNMSITLIANSIWNNPGNHRRRLRKTLDMFFWQLQKRALRKPRSLRLANGILFKAYPDCVVSSSLVYADWPEYHELMFIRKHLKPGDIVVDVGAYVGHISLLLADKVKPNHLFAFEPTPSAFQRLKENWRLNDWPLTNLFRAAVGAESGTVFVKDGASPSTKNIVAETARHEYSVEVPLVRLDDYLSVWHESPIGLLKIDVEGYEAKVFKGSRRLLQEARPRLIMFESLNGQLQQAVSEPLIEHKYVIFQLDGNGQPRFDSYEAQNLFAIPQERRAVFS